MHYRFNALAIVISAVIAMTFPAGGMADAGPESYESICSDSAEASIWAEDLAREFTGIDEESASFRQANGLERVDSTAVVGPVTDAATCSAIASTVEARLPAGFYPHRLLITQIGRYYVVPVLDTTPPPDGIVVARRTLTLVLDKETLAILVDNLLV